MGVTVFHSLTATTPDNTQYEIKPSNWNSNHFVSLSLQGSDLSNAFSNSPTVTFGTSGGLMTASVNTAYVALSNSSSIMPIASSSNFLGTAASGSFIATSLSSSIMPIASSSNFLGSAASGSFIATSNSSLFQQTSNSSLFQQTSATSAITSAAFPSAQTTKFAGTGTTFSGTNVSGSMTLNSNGLNLALSAGVGGGGSFSAGISTGGNTSGNTGTVSNQIVFVGGNNVTLSGSTAAGGATVTISGANIGGAQTGISGVAVSNTTYTSGTFSFRDGNNISFASGTGQGVSITHNLQSAGAYLTTAMQSNAGSNFLGTNTALTANGVSMTANSSGLSLNFPAFLTSQSNQAFSASGGSSTFQTLNFANSNGVTFSNSGGSVIASVPGTSSISATGIVSISTNGNTISIGAPAMSIGVSGGNTSGNTGTVSNQFVLAGGNNITLSGSTNAAGMTVTVSANTAAAANLSVSAGTTSGAFGGITFANSNNVTFGLNNGTITASAPSGGGGGVAAAAGSQTQTSGTVLFSNSNGITFGMSNSSVITASYTVPTVPTAYVSSINGSSGAISLNVGSSLSASTNGSSITFGLASNITTALQSAGAYLTTAAQSSASNVSQVIVGTAAAGGTATLTGGVSFSNANGISFYSSAGNAVVASYTVPTVPTAYVSSINGSSGAISLNVGSSLSASTNGSSITFGLASNITTALQSANANYLTSQSNQAFSASGGSSTFQTLNFANSNGVTFSNSGGSVIASVPGTSSISATGAVSISTNGNTISIGAPAFSAGVTTLGNTLGNTGTVSNQLVLAGGNNITLSGSTNAGGMTLTISGPNVGGAQTGISGIIAGTQTQTAGTVSFANSNGITFGMSNSSVITASYTVPTVPTAYVSSVNGSSGAISLNVGSSLSASTNGSSITFGLASNITTALQSAGAYLTTAAQSSASNVSLVIAGTAPGGGTASLSGGVSFSNANGVSFYTSAGNAIVASIGAAPTAYVSSVNGSSGAISLNVGSSLSASTNGSSITFGLASNITTALQSAGAYLTTAAQSSASNVSQVIVGTAAAGGTATLTGGVSFSNANGISFYSSAGNAVVASYTVPTVPTAYVSSVNGSSGAISLNVGSSLSASTNGSSITFGLASNITTALQSANANYLTSQSNQAFSASGGSSTFQTLNFANSNGVTFSNSGGSVVASHNGITQQSTQPVAISGSNGSFAFSTVTFGNSNNFSFYTTNGSVVGSYTVPTVPAQTNQTVGFYASSQTTGQSSSSTFDARSMSFVGAGGISVGASNGSIIFSGATGGGGGGGVAFANSQTTYTSGTVSLREGGGAITIASNTGQRIDISVPDISSIYGTNGILISSAGSSISIQNDYNKTWEVAPALSGVAIISTLSASTLAFMPLFPQDNYTFSGVQMLGSFAVASNTRASYAASHTISYALYSVNQTATTMSQLGSSSLAIFVSASSNNSGAYTISYNTASSATSSSAGTGLFSALSGQKLMNLLFASSLMDGGAYALGIGYSSSTPNAAEPLSAISFNQIRYLSNISAFGVLDGTSAAATANSYLPDGVPFVYSATSGGWPSTIGFSQRRQLPTYQFPYVMFRGT